MDTDDPAVVVEIAFVVHGRSRDGALALADQLGNQMLAHIGGEPWKMYDDDWTRTIPPERLVITDSDGFMYMGKRRYVFHGPHVGLVSGPEHDGFRTQGRSQA